MKRKATSLVLQVLLWGMFFMVTGAPIWPTSFSLIVEENDGSPRASATTLKVTNGTLSFSGATATLDLTGAGGPAGTIVEVTP